MKKLRTKVILWIISMVLISTLSTISFGVINSITSTDHMMEVSFEMNLNAAMNVLKSTLQNQYGIITYKDDMLYSQDQVALFEQFDVIDRLSSDMEIVATLFAKQGDQFIRITTSVQDQAGKRAIGTPLDPTGAAYKAIQNK